MWGGGGLRHRCFLPLFCRRCLSSSPERFAVNQSFTSALETLDGRVFRYAAVVVTGMKNEDSAYFAWKHACSLVGASPPTVAIAFFSKRTESAIQTIKGFSKEFAQRTLKDVIPDKEAQSAFMPPLIGCFMADQIWGDSASSLRKAKTVAGDEFIWIADADDEGDTPKFNGEGKGCMDKNGQKSGTAGGHKMEGIDRKKVEVPSSSGCQLMKFDNDKNDQEDTYTDWEDLVREYDYQKVVPETFLKDSQGSQILTQDMDFLVNIGSSKDKDDKQELANFLNQLTKGTELKGDNPSRPSSGDRSSKSDQNIDISAQDAYQCNECTEPGGEVNKWVLCVANMEGVKAAGFSTRTTGLPWLPDLATAVTANNPHMLLLASPGFKLEELSKRLASMFPKSSRAGAVLHLIDSRSITDSGVFCGERFLPSGAVGISFSSSDGGLIPVDALSEFVRMSIGMMFESSFDPFFDDAVCNYLFLPNGRKVEWLKGHSNGKPHLDLVLDQMYAKLHQDYRDDSSSYNLKIQSSIPELDRLAVISIDKVLFPGFFIPLFIEKPCDKLMVKNCMEHCKEFGLFSLCTDMDLDPMKCKDIIGTVVKIKVNLFDEFCKSYIIVHGVRRFRVLDRIDIQPGTFGQLSGQVEFIDDLEPEDDVEKSEIMELASRALSLCHNLFPSAATVMSIGESFKDPILVSFAIGQILPVSIEVKRRWLRMVNTKYRLKEQMTFLNA